MVGTACPLSLVLLWSLRGHYTGGARRIWGVQVVRDQSGMRHKESLLTFELGSHIDMCSGERKYRDDFKCWQSMQELVGFN